MKFATISSWAQIVVMLTDFFLALTFCGVVKLSLIQLDGLLGSSLVSSFNPLLCVQIYFSSIVFLSGRTPTMLVAGFVVRRGKTRPSIIINFLRSILYIPLTFISLHTLLFSHERVFDPIFKIKMVRVTERGST